MVAAGGAGIRVHARSDARRARGDAQRTRPPSGVGFSLEEEAIPVRPEVAAACEFLGLDPLNVANEGKLVAIVAPEAATPARGDEGPSARPRSRDHRPRGRGRQALRRDAHRRSAAGASSTGSPASNCRASAESPMRILLLCHSFNSLTQRLHVALREAGHEVAVEFDVNER